LTYKFTIRSNAKIKHSKFRGNTDYLCHKYGEDYTTIAKVDTKQEAVAIVKSLNLDPNKIERYAPESPRMINLNYAAGNALREYKEELEKQLGVNRISYSDIVLRLLPL